MNYYNKLCFYLAAQQFDEGANPGRMSRPGRGSYKFSVHNSVVGASGRFNPDRANRFHFRPDCRIGGHFFALDHIGGHKDLRPVANGCDWLAGSEKPARDIQHLFIEAQIFGRAAAGDNQASIIIRIYLFM